MQEVHPIPPSAGAGGERVLLRRHHHQHPQQQALKCPRCDSTNTKFCYYNNYNLSQPRHFCKNCRRYWTKGGVLRNVPVGGGCRKSKRSSKPKTSPTHSSTPAAAAVSSGSDVGGGLFQVSEAGDYGGLMSLMGSNSSEQSHELGFNGGAVEVEDSATASFGEFMQNQTAAGVQEWEENMNIMCGVDDLDPTVTIEDLLQNRGSSGGFATLDWNQTAENVDQGLFDQIRLPNSNVDHHFDDHQGYWTQTTTTTFHHPQWSDNSTHHPLFLP